jgi:ATP-dependent DNA ligase
MLRRRNPFPAPAMTRRVAGRRRAAAALPEWIAPQLTRLVDAAPEGPDWLHEIKFDDYRMHARLDRGAVRLLTRTGLDWTHKYPAIAAAVASLGVRQAYLDGELCGVFPDGLTSFSMIQAASDAGNAAGLVYFIFDLLHVDGEDIAALPLVERKARLATSCRASPRLSITAIITEARARHSISRPANSRCRRRAPAASDRRWCSAACIGCGLSWSPRSSFSPGPTRSCFGKSSMMACARTSRHPR